MNSLLFSPIKLRELELKNRIVVSPMCQYSAENGVPNQWHLVHLGSRAVGGAALVICEATAVSPEGRISLGDLGIWNDEQTQAFCEITKFIKSQGSIPAIQIAHAGRKAGTSIPWKSEKGGWIPLAPSAIPFDKESVVPQEMTEADIQIVTQQFQQAAKKALLAGFEVAEIHMAHGYLLNEFLSPLSNLRKDQYGGSIENRMRFPLNVANSIRDIWPESRPVFVRISASEWMDGGWTLEDSILFSKELKKIGIDVIDCSSGGSSPLAQIKPGPGYQVPFSEGVRKGAEIKTGAVGIIVEAKQAEEILQAGQAELIIIGREFLRDPYWPLH
ncbi:MAG: NADH:flavin oxidoreductase/NADH oxidase, partial [Pseudobdellovibrio sp.]